MEQWADCHSYTSRNYRNHSTVQYGRRDLIFVLSNISDMCEKCLLDSIPHIQHGPICVTVNPVIVPQPTRRRFNMEKANWDGVSTEFDAAIEEV